MESLNMKEETKPMRKRLLDEGWREFLIVGCSDEVKSKGGNNQYVLKVQDVLTGYEENLYAVSEPKKRWFLKSLLDACNINCVDGIYNFEPPLSKNLIGNKIMGLVEHEDNEYINRACETVKIKQHKIVEVKSVGIKAWDE